MLFGNIQPMQMLLSVPGIVIGFAFHEFAHAYVADKLGDPTPRQQGKLTIDPLTHIDLFGFILLLFAGFGWAKPVYVNRSYFKKPARDNLLVSIAGPVMNLLLAVLFMALLKWLGSANLLSSLDKSLQQGVIMIIYLAVSINISLFIFNMLPIHPLDGYNVILYFIPYGIREKFYQFQQYSTILLLVVILFLGSYILSPIHRIILNGLFDLFHM